MYSKELVKGTLQTVILRLLKEQGPDVWLEMNNMSKEVKEGKYQLTEGSFILLCYFTNGKRSIRYDEENKSVAAPANTIV